MEIGTGGEGEAQGVRMRFPDVCAAQGVVQLVPYRWQANGKECPRSSMRKKFGVARSGVGSLE